MYVICRTVEKQVKMVTVYTELSIKDQENNKLATLNHNQQENSNLIMPFLVQNDNKMIKGLTTL